MKIIKQIDTSGWRFHTVCDKCETELEADSSDVVYNHYAGDQREPYSYETYHIVCPVCTGHITVPKDKMSKALQLQIQKKMSKPPYGGPFDR
jgi:hypothetical protein